jgi:hypothetical protein
MNRASGEYPGGRLQAKEARLRRDDDIRKLTVSAAVTGTLNHKSETYFDTLYRPVETVEKDPAGDVVQDTLYDGNGRAYRFSAPYRGGASDSTTTAFDSLDRPLVIVNPDSTSVSFYWEWCRDVFTRDIESIPRDGSPCVGTGNERVLRGGCFHNWAVHCTVWKRYEIAHDYSDEAIGFRLVLSIESGQDS